MERIIITMERVIIIKDIRRIIYLIYSITMEHTDLVCDKCGYVFMRRFHLEKHIKNKSCKIRKHECKYCDKKFTTENSMYRHMKYSCKVKKKEDKKKI
jgi:hypothetical protein